MEVHLVLFNFILVVWRSSDYGVDLVLSNFILVQDKVRQNKIYRCNH
jgi:hypothetical protein